VCLGASQCAAIALQTLWVATWLRDVAGYTPAEVARGLLVINAVMIVGYLAFGRAADALQRRGRSALPLMAGGVAAASMTLASIILAPRLAPIFLWSVFIVAATAVVLGYSILSRRYPKAMAGRANTAINVFAFVGSFAGQWGIGLVLDRWPQTAQGYAPEAYTWALGAVWAVQLAGLAWLWSGRSLLERRATAAA
jgi:predicted MFS family arabinose efflux permease